MAKRNAGTSAARQSSSRSTSRARGATATAPKPSAQRNPPTCKPPRHVPRHIAELAVTERAWQSGHGRPLYPTERAELHSWMRYPDDNDVYYRDLVFKQILSEEGAGPPLSAEEAADLMPPGRSPRNSRTPRSSSRTPEAEFRKLVSKNTARKKR